MSDIRVRIAPSPSGFLHIGTAKVALMNWLYARKSGGSFVLRLEDTDADRTDEAYVAAMCEGFKWLGIHWDEGPEFGGEPERGDFGPYRQSERVERHKEAIQQLIDSGHAYRCYCSKEQLEAEREAARNEKRLYRHGEHCPDSGRDSAPARDGNPSDAPVVRFKVPEGETIVRDLLQGNVTTRNDQVDDFVIAKPNGDPLFHLAVVVDDGDMKISHVIRGDDHLTNAAKHVMLFEALGYEVPQFAHLPMVLDEKGKKYSKREHGANVLDWRDDGYLPEALINYVVLQGWSAGDDKEVYTIEELQEAFSLERLGKSAARFDLKKLQWLNGQQIRLIPLETLVKRIAPVLQDAGFDTDSKSEEWLRQLADITQEKLSTIGDIVALSDYFFVEPAEYEAKGVKKHWRKEGAHERLALIAQTLEAESNWTHEVLHDAVKALAESREEGLGKYVGPLRLALTGKSVGPGLFELAELLDKECCMERIQRGLERIQELNEEAQA